MNELKDRIRQLMDELHMNQQSFAQLTRIGTASLSSIFNGRTRPTMNHVMGILDTLPDVNPLWLLRGEGPMLFDHDSEVERQHDSLAATSSASLSSPASSPAPASPSSPAPAPALPTSGADDVFASAFDSAVVETPQAQQRTQQQSLFNQQNTAKVAQPRIAHSPQTMGAVVRHGGGSTSQRQPRTAPVSVPQPQPAQAPASIAGIVMQPATAAPAMRQRRITEIRVFFDDQTWETFVPKNN